MIPALPLKSPYFVSPLASPGKAVLCMNEPRVAVECYVAELVMWSAMRYRQRNGLPTRVSNNTLKIGFEEPRRKV